MKRYAVVILNLFLAGTAMAQQAMDVHSHTVLPEFTALLEQHDAALEETFPLPAWDVASHLKFMEKAGIGTSVLSMPAPPALFRGYRGMPLCYTGVQ